MSYKEEVKELKKEITKIVNKYKDRYNFITYHNANCLISDMDNILHGIVQEMVENQCYDDAFNLSSYMFIKLSKIEMDDSAGYLSVFYDECIKLWDNIIEISDAKTNNKIFQWLMKYLNNDYIFDFAQERLEPVFMNNFKDKKHLNKKLSFTKEKADFIIIDNEWLQNYEVAKWLCYHLQVMKELDFSYDELAQFCKDNYQYSSIRKAYVLLCIEQQKYNEATDILNESIHLDRKYNGLVNDHYHQLKDIYYLQGDIEAYKNQLWLLITRYDMGNMDDYKELKSLYNSNEWLYIREDIFDILSKHSYVDKFYKEEGLYDRLLDFVVNSDGLNPLYNYEDDLKDKYPKELLQKYTIELNKMAYIGGKRSKYRNWVKILRKMLKIDGGEEAVKQIVDDWKVKYRNRPALLEELNRL
ncbi:MAG: hypothetical protein LUH02_03275 [Erysipelotrichaceae bacterium]|nr:hypothetical protein [Erysipelotrichaceae bacterium]